MAPLHEKQEAAGGETPSVRGLRVLLGPVDTASFASRLGAALATKGATCWLFTPSTHRYQQDPAGLVGVRLWGASVVVRLGRLREKGRLARAAATVVRTFVRLAGFVWSLWAVDAVVFLGSRSLLKGDIDLLVYRLLGKRVVRVFLGSDSRPYAISGFRDAVLDAAKGDRAAKKLLWRMRRQMKRVRRLSRWSHVVVDNPLCGHYQEKPFVSWFSVGFPHAPGTFGIDAQGPLQRQEDGLVRVLHCPSRSVVKGTAEIDAAVVQLQKEGLPIEYDCVTGVPRGVVLQRLAACDLVVDQLYADTPMAGLASEAAAFGKPTVVGGYGWEELRRRVPEGELPPNILCEPEGLVQTLRGAVQDAALRRKSGDAAHAFVHGFWRDGAVADRFARILCTPDSVPEGWWCDPREITYWQGLGAPKAHRRAVLDRLGDRWRVWA